MVKGLLALVLALTPLVMTWGDAVAQKPTRAPILSGPLARLDLKDAEIVTARSNFVPIYLNPFVHAVGPRVLPAGEGFHRYWDTPQAGYPYPWEVWEVKADK